MTAELRIPGPTANGSGPARGLSLPEGFQDDLTPTSSPTNSPRLTRTRIMSVSNPEPVIRLVAEGLIRKGDSMQEMLEDRLLASVLEDADGIVKPDHKGWYGKGSSVLSYGVGKGSIHTNLHYI